MKKLVLLCCVVSLVLLSGCAESDLFSPNSSEMANLIDLFESYTTYSEYGITLLIQRDGQQFTVTEPVNWFVSGEIPLTVRPFIGKDLFLAGTGGEATAGLTFTGGGCTGEGYWPVTLFVAGFVSGEPECFIQLNVVGLWVGGGSTTMVCDAGGGSSVNPTLGYRHEKLRFTVENNFIVQRPGTGIPSPGAAGDAPDQWPWQNTWELTSVNLPDITDCGFDVGE